MGICRDGKAQVLQPKKLGGRRAVLFVYAMEAMENMAFIASAVSLVTYFSGYMNFDLTKSANTLTNFMGTSFLLPIMGGFISDTFLSRFKTCIIFGFIELIGYALLTVQAHFDFMRPKMCPILGNNSQSNCESAHGGQAAILFSGLYLVALGTGGVKAALPALGADQFDKRDEREAPDLSSFFNWFLFSLTIGASFGVTFVVWVSVNQGWEWGFGICTVAILLAIFSLYLGRSNYRVYVPVGRSPVLRILQVFVATARNWRLSVPKNSGELYELHDKEAGPQGETLKRTDQFRFLDRAAIPKDSITHTTHPWHLCTMTQVEETKILMRMLPIIASTIFMNTCLAQLQTFSIQQGVTMEPHLGKFKVPASSIPVIPLIFMAILVPIYEKVFVPVARKMTGIPTGISHLQRIGVGLVLSIISMSIAGVIETKRKSVAIEHNMVDTNNIMNPLPMSVFWLGFQYAIFGAADMFTLVGLLEFFYSESSIGMKTLGTSISWCSLAFGYYTSTVVVEVVNKVSDGWLSGNNLNRDHLSYFYWLLAGLSAVNFGNYLYWAKWYKYKSVVIPKEDDK